MTTIVPANTGNNPNYNITAGDKKSVGKELKPGKAASSPDVLVDISSKPPEKLTYDKPVSSLLEKTRDEAESQYLYILELLKAWRPGKRVQKLISTLTQI